MKGNRLLIRADGDSQMGTGHVMRCLALAQAWQTQGGMVQFVMARSTPALEKRLTADNLTLCSLKTQPGSLDDAAQLIKAAQELEAAWVVVDGYAFSAKYQTAVSEAHLPLLLVDDFGSTDPFTANIIVNQNIYALPEQYPNRLTAARLLMGCHYALLRREFWPWRGWRREISANTRKILVTLGGSDPDNVTLLVIQGLLQLTAVDYEAIVVVGGSNLHVESLETAVTNTSIRLQKNVHNMPELMAWADVAVAAGGSTSWELAFMGLPTLAVVLVDNQEKIVRGLGQAGVVVNLGWHYNLTAEQIGAEIGRLLQNPTQRKEMSQRGQQLIDGYGTERVVQTMTRQNNLLRARPAVFQDVQSLFQWVNDPLTRQMSFHSEPIPWENHRQWLEKVLTTPQRSLLIVEIWQDERWVAAGQVRFDEDGTVSIGLAPEQRGKRLALPVLQTAVTFYHTCYPQKQLVAYIKPDNIPSQKIFTQAGFASAGSAEVSGNPCLKFVLGTEP